MVVSEGGESHGSEVTNRHRLGGRRIGVTRHWTVASKRHEAKTRVNPAKAEGIKHKVPWVISCPVGSDCFYGRDWWGQGSEKPVGVIVVPVGVVKSRA